MQIENVKVSVLRVIPEKTYILFILSDFRSRQRASVFLR